MLKCELCVAAQLITWHIPFVCAALQHVVYMECSQCSDHTCVGVLYTIQHLTRVSCGLCVHTWHKCPSQLLPVYTHNIDMCVLSAYATYSSRCTSYWAPTIHIQWCGMIAHWLLCCMYVCGRWHTGQLLGFLSWLADVEVATYVCR